MPFDREEDDSDDEPRYHLTREGGHSHRRILHAADATGMAMQTSLQDNAHNHPNIQVLERHNALDLITEDKIGGKNKVIGAYVWNRNAEHVENGSLKFCGGWLYQAVHQSVSVYFKPRCFLGDNIAIWRAGCRVANLSSTNSIQPVLPSRSAQLPANRSLARRRRLSSSSRRFALYAGFDAREELAPRDVVARAIDFEMKRLGAVVSRHQPQACRFHHQSTSDDDLSRLTDLGIDMTKEPIPIVPAAHYTCGGVMVDKTAKPTSKSLRDWRSR